MNCGSCGNPVTQGTQFCGSCGAQIAWQASAPQPVPSVTPPPVTTQQPAATIQPTVTPAPSQPAPVGYPMQPQPQSQPQPVAQPQPIVPAPLPMYPTVNAPQPMVAPAGFAPVQDQPGAAVNPRSIKWVKATGITAIVLGAIIAFIGIAALSDAEVAETTGPGAVYLVLGALYGALGTAILRVTSIGVIKSLLYGVIGLSGVIILLSLLGGGGAGIIYIVLVAFAASALNAIKTSVPGQA